jgi:pantothenate kinase
MARIVDFPMLLAATHDLLSRSGRHFLAIAGAPGAGKSTVAKRILKDLELSHPGTAAILPMDGFHYDNAVLLARGRQPWKGAPDTFDVGGLISTLVRLKNSSEGPVAVPVFDRELEISRGSARIIAPEVQLIIVEGNYLLLDEAPWTALKPLFDLTVMIEVPETELRQRLHQRWVRYGLAKEQIADKLENNDLPNGKTVQNHSRTADLIFKLQ